MNILALVESENHVCCRYRLRAFEPALRARAHDLVFEALSPKLFARMRQLLRAREYDAVILQRRLLPTWQWDLLRARARRLIFDLDDAVFHHDSYHKRGIEDRRRRARFVRVAREADALLAGNRFLEDSALSAGANRRSVHAMPTCVDPSAYPLANHERAADNGLRGVWIGSSSTLKGLEQSAALWKALGARFSGLRLRLISDRFASFSPLKTENVAWQQDSEASDIAACDFGISWLPDDDWSRGKCGLKVLQYQAAGLPIVANGVGVQNTLVDDGVSGFLASSVDEWAAAIAALASPERRREMGRVGRASVERDYSVSAWADRFVEMVIGSAQPLPPIEGVARQSAAKTPHARRIGRANAQALGKR